ncbi:SsrA-binding protein SmpB [Gilvimarinus algae]|uniref:SsrA-binding protein n=1 Tax=Gilvimarinus algae TaxID=3058037 RepID=A0ABT8TK82_9GAMM|nr:SsrA-binding protein SmpB [Gilvimarinus sp. SDUM040014]MDO3383783.1 SsrA-binding protein SmpB [Gilvimarinus sp. SDUM040014]
MAKKQKSKPGSSTIALNKKAKFDYQLQDKLEAGIVLLGWEVKSARAGKVQLTDTYVIFQNGEAWLVGAQFSPLPTVSTHFVAEPMRSRKLLMHDRELARLQQAAEQKGYTVVATAMYWKQHLIKVEVALGKGKQLHDKRETEKERDWNRQKQRLFQQA